MGSMLFTVMAALAQMEHEIRRERINDSISKRREAGKDLGGRPRRITDSQIRTALRLVEDGEPAAQVARDLGMSRASFYRRSQALRTPKHEKCSVGPSTGESSLFKQVDGRHGGLESTDLNVDRIVFMGLPTQWSHARRISGVLPDPRDHAPRGCALGYGCLQFVDDRPKKSEPCFSVDPTPG
jgi:hypothetical protein